MSANDAHTTNTPYSHDTGEILIDDAFRSAIQYARSGARTLQQLRTGVHDAGLTTAVISVMVAMLVLADTKNDLFLLRFVLQILVSAVRSIVAVSLGPFLPGLTHTHVGAVLKSVDDAFPAIVLLVVVSSAVYMLVQYNQRRIHGWVHRVLQRRPELRGVCVCVIVPILTRSTMMWAITLAAPMLFDSFFVSLGPELRELRMAHSPVQPLGFFSRALSSHMCTFTMLLCAVAVLALKARILQPSPVGSQVIEMLSTFATGLFYVHVALSSAEIDYVTALALTLMCAPAVLAIGVVAVHVLQFMSVLAMDLLNMYVRIDHVRVVLHLAVQYALACGVSVWCFTAGRHVAATVLEDMLSEQILGVGLRAPMFLPKSHTSFAVLVAVYASLWCCMLWMVLSAGSVVMWLANQIEVIRCQPAWRRARLARTNAPAASSAGTDALAPIAAMLAKAVTSSDPMGAVQTMLTTVPASVVVGAICNVMASFLAGSRQQPANNKRQLISLSIQVAIPLEVPPAEHLVVQPAVLEVPFYTNDGHDLFLLRVRMEACNVSRGAALLETTCTLELETSVSHLLQMIASQERSVNFKVFLDLHGASLATVPALRAHHGESSARRALKQFTAAVLRMEAPKRMLLMHVERGELRDLSASWLGEPARPQLMDPAVMSAIIEGLEETALYNFFTLVAAWRDECNSPQLSHAPETLERATGLLNKLDAFAQRLYLVLQRCLGKAPRTPDAFHVPSTEVHEQATRQSTHMLFIDALLAFSDVNEANNTFESHDMGGLAPQFSELIATHNKLRVRYCDCALALVGVSLRMTVAEAYSRLGATVDDIVTPAGAGVTLLEIAALGALLIQCIVQQAALWNRIPAEARDLATGGSAAVRTGETRDTAEFASGRTAALPTVLATSNASKPAAATVTTRPPADEPAGDPVAVTPTSPHNVSTFKTSAVPASAMYPPQGSLLPGAPAMPPPPMRMPGAHAYTYGRTHTDEWPCPPSGVAVQVQTAPAYNPFDDDELMMAVQAVPRAGTQRHQMPLPA